jgi:hypothetical protein
MDFVKNIDRKVLALQEAEMAMLSLNSHLGKEYFPPETLAMISELKVDLADIRYEQELRSETFGEIS